MKRNIGPVGIVLAVVVVSGATARAEEGEPEIQKPMTPPPRIQDSVHEGALLPSTLAPRVGAAPALAFGVAGWDGARSAPIAGATAEVRVWGPFALRGGAEYSSARKQARPTIGGRVQLLRQDRHGVDGSLAVFYRPEGFTEPEGEIESFIALGRRFDRLSLLANLVYGQDPEGNERDGELRFASLYGAGRWTVGLDSRLRFAIGAPRSATATGEPKLDLLAGPTAAMTVGQIALFAEAGPSILKLAGPASFGVAAVGGVGTVF